MVPVISEWKENMLATLIKRLPKNAQNELAATQRRVFASMMVVFTLIHFIITKNKITSANGPTTAEKLTRPKNPKKIPKKN